LQQFEEAIKQYEHVLASDPDHADAKANKALLEKLLEQQQEQQHMLDSEEMQLIQMLEMQGGQIDMELLEEILARGGGSAEIQQALLQMLAQQEQEQRMQAAQEAARKSRPDEHYLTIAQNGTYSLESLEQCDAS